MNSKLLFTLVAAPLIAHGQIYQSSTGISTSLDGGLRYAAPEYDADAAAYFIRAGVTDATAKRQISNFIRGVKSLGLWANIVCWPMRSSQNAGNGTTVYSLGGLGTYDGTLVNSPTWGTGGIAFASAFSQCMTTTFTWGSSESVSSFASVITASAQGTVYLMGQATTPRFCAQIFPLSASAGTAVVFSQNSTFQPATSGATEFPTSISFFAGYTATNGSRSGQVNGENVFSSTTSSGPGIYANTMNLMASTAAGANSVNGTLTFFCVSKSATLSDMQQIRALLKTTLCQGLSLP